jgi:glycosyltransferase involved in cell wall biosynthesis
MDKPRLTIVTNNLYTFGGGEKLALDIATGLKGKFEVTILNQVSPQDVFAIDKKRIGELYDLSGIRIIDLKSAGLKTRAFGTEPFVLRVPKPAAYAQFMDAFKKADIVYVMSLSPFMLINSVFFARLLRKKLVLGIHNFSLAKILESNSGFKQRLVRKNLVALLGRIGYFHVTSRRDLDLVRRFLPKAKVSLIPNLIREPKRPIRVNPTEFICLYVGRLEVGQKGIDLLCKIAERTIAEYSSIKFEIVGEGGDGETLVSELSRKYPKNVAWRGFLSGKQLDDAYSRASLLIFPSRYDTFSLVLLEAQGHGLPCLAFDIYGPRDIITHQFQGTLVKAFDVGKFSERIGRYYDIWKNKSSYRRLRERISRYAYSKYRKEAIIKELGSFFLAVQHDKFNRKIYK